MRHPGTLTWHITGNLTYFFSKYRIPVYLNQAVMKDGKVEPFTPYTASSLQSINLLVFKKPVKSVKAVCAKSDSGTPTLLHGLQKNYFFVQNPRK